MPISRIKTDGIQDEAVTSAKIGDNIDLDGQFVRVPHGTTAERPSSPVAGYLRFNTTIGTLEQWNTNTLSWAAVDSPPIITSVAYPGSVTAADPAGGETITVNGSNFKTGFTVTVGGTTAPTTSFVSSTQITFTTPAKTAGDYDVVVTNSNGLAATATNGISFNGLPAFTTAAGNLGSISEDEVMSTITIVAAEPDGGTLAYSVTSGALPTGVSLGSANGQLTGTPNTNVTSDTTFNFTVTATDDESQTNSRAFNLIVLRLVYATQISNSLMLNDNDTQYLQRTPSSVGNRRTWTWSSWVKRATTSGTQVLWEVGDGSSNRNYIRYNTDQIYVQISTLGYIQLNRIDRDVSGWTHLTLSVDTTQATASDRIKLYINGQLQESLAGSSYPTQNADTDVNNTTYPFSIGASPQSFGQYWDGYISDIYFVDGQALTPTSFAEEHNGVWVPKSFSGTYGTNGFHLEFGDSSAIGDDTSGNANDFTNNNIGSWRVVPDSPTNNYPVTNRRIRFNTGEFRNGNLQTVAVGGGSGLIGPAGSTFNLKSGKWYFEMRLDGGSSSDSHFAGAYVYRDNDADRYGQELASPYSSQIYSGGSVVQSGLPAGVDGTVYGFAVDVDNKTCQIYKDGSAHGTSVDWSSHPFADNGFIGMGHYHGSSSSNSTITVNYGQNPTFGGSETAGNNVDANGEGNFLYSVPSGYLAMCQRNIAEPSIVVKTNERPQDYFNTVTYSGDNTTGRSITGFGFQPDLVWIKSRTYADNHTLTDSIRGGTAQLRINLGNAESQFGNMDISFNSDGFTNAGSAQNETGRDFVAWGWKAGGAPTATNSAGAGNVPTSGSVMIDGVASTATLAGTVAANKITANTKSGFSIVSWTGSGATGGTIAHGLGKKPSMIIAKSRDQNNYGHIVWHQGLTASSNEQDNYIYINRDGGTTTVQNSITNYWGTSGSINTSTFGVFANNGSSNNFNGGAMIAYVWAEIEGYSKIGSYVGNANDGGAFIYCGFKPAFVMMANVSLDVTWYMIDNKIGNNEGNTVPGKFLMPSQTNTQDTPTGVDFYSNGFKLVTVGSGQNQSGVTHIYMAFAEDPFKYSEAK